MNSIHYCRSFLHKQLLLITNLLQRRFFTLYLVLFLPMFVKSQLRLALIEKEKAESYFLASDYHSAIEKYEKSISICNYCPDTLKVSLHLGLAKMYKYDEQLENTYLNLIQAEKRALKSRSKEYLCLTYVSFSEYFRSVRNYDKAREYLQKCHELISQNSISDRTLMEYYHRKAAVLSEGDSNCLETIYFSNKNIALAQKWQNKDLEAVSLNEIGFAYEKMNPAELSKSISFYLRAAEIWEKTGEAQSLANVWANLVRVYYKTNQLDLALFYYQKGDKLAKEKNFLFWRTSFKHQQYKIYRSQNKLVKALEALEEYDKLNAEFREKHWVKAMAKAENEHETKQKDQTIKLNQLQLKNQDLRLKKNIQDQNILLLIIIFVSILFVIILWYSSKTKRSNKKLHLLLNENQFLLGESNHRIKNNLQLIIALVYQEMEKQDVDLEENSLFEIVGKIEAVSTLHKQLYTNESKQLIRIDSYLDEVKDHFLAFFEKRKIDVHFEIDHLEIEINKSLYLGILCTELIINSLKHAFNQENKEKKITLSLQKKNDAIQFFYSDSGPGLPNPNARMKLVHMMSQQMDFKYEIILNGSFCFSADLTNTLKNK